MNYALDNELQMLSLLLGNLWCHTSEERDVYGDEFLELAEMLNELAEDAQGAK